ncbi:bifunctional methionine sulfoxide reductase B/A protein [Coprothermobacter platensis]|uniref:bifunctional methionine sulfoxide reductase B/A protein n=1 Tax=Coprothermobacter platensis TaxID=108819 RepID=UPI0003672D6A|nr:bifunctional methionine sulfoxide reductase B/A protein [Coprothermobacter platensis]
MEDKKDFSELEKKVMFEKATERPFTGEYYDFFEEGTYVCKNCGLPLYRSQDKFHSECGWPSFDDEVPGAVRRQLDADGIRTEIVCGYCGAHLGHVFTGEGYTEKDTRHCVNSVSLRFLPKGQKPEKEQIFFAAGCFWGVEHLFKRFDGVLDTEVGFMGGHKENPTYKEVCTGTTGHAETVRVVYDTKIDVEDLIKYFFEIHDFTQVNRQGPDWGEQYRSVIFYTSDEQKEKAEKTKAFLLKRYNVATKIEKASTFWPAEDYHQDYYDKTGGTPYCHYRRTVFDKDIPISLD